MFPSSAIPEEGMLDGKSTGSSVTRIVHEDIGKFKKTLLHPEDKQER